MGVGSSQWIKYSSNDLHFQVYGNRGLKIQKSNLNEIESRRRPAARPNKPTPH